MKNPEHNFNTNEKEGSLDIQKESSNLLNRIHKNLERFNELPPELANKVRLITTALVIMVFSHKGMAQTVPPPDSTPETTQGEIFPSFGNDDEMTEEEKEEKQEEAKEKADEVIEVVLDNTKYEDMYRIAKDVVNIFKKDDDE